MKISITTHHDITFRVQAFWDEEGGMGQDDYGQPCGNLNDAVAQLELARKAKPDREWMITGEVKTQVVGKP